MLDELINDGGGEGEIWTVKGRTSPSVVKLYDEPAERHGSVARLMPKLRDAYGNPKVPSVARPLATIHALDDGTFIGVGSHYYAPSSWTPLESLAGSRRWPLDARLEVARGLAKSVDAAHTHEFVIGDLNPSNILINTSERRALHVDVDSWGWSPAPADSPFANVSNELPIVAPMAKPGSVPPSATGRSGTQATDRFALFVLIMWLLTRLHPYSSNRRGGPEFKTTQERINNGSSWLADPTQYSLPRNEFPSGHPGLGAFPAGLQKHARNALVGSYPLPSDWISALASTSVVSCPTCQQLMLCGAECVTCYGSPVPANSSVVTDATTGPIPDLPVIAFGRLRRRRTWIAAIAGALAIVGLIVVLVLFA